MKLSKEEHNMVTMVINDLADKIKSFSKEHNEERAIGLWLSQWKDYWTKVLKDNLNS